jgi:hypothetical protein
LLDLPPASSLSLVNIGNAPMLLHTDAHPGADSACHMCKSIDAPQVSLKTDTIVAEEIQNASTVVPWVMISSIMLNGTMGFALLVY